MLAYLYHFCENLLVTIVNDLHRLNWGQLTWNKWGTLMGLLLVVGYGLMYVVKQFSQHVTSLLGYLIDWRQLGLFGWAQYLIAPEQDKI